MSRSRPTQFPLPLHSPSVAYGPYGAVTHSARPIPRVELAQEPPAGTRWLACGEKLEATDLWVFKGEIALIWDKIAGMRMHKKDVGAFARKL